jgi:hypothetical protein
VKQRLFVLFLLLFFWSNHSKISAQTISIENWGIKIGVVAQFGTHINQIGLRSNAYFKYGFGQINLDNTSTFSISHLAGRKAMFENRLAIGGLILGGKRTQNPDFVWGSLNHQTAYQNAIGYNYLWYKDNAKTSQKSGGWALQFSDFQLFFENDIFAGFGQDKFRTGHLRIAYRYEDKIFGAGLQLWTGETRGSRWEKTQLENCPNGYRLLEDLPYGRTSHGILFLEAKQSLAHGNHASARLGFDSEQVRHLFQNRLSHDLIWLPNAIERHTPHYPRLDDDGCPVFYKNDMRKTLFFGQLGINNIWSY